MADNERFRYAEVRQKLIDALVVDLMGPMSEDEILDENPMFAYIIGMLYPQSVSSVEGTDMSEQEVDADASYEDRDSSMPDEDDNEIMVPTKFKQQSSIGISFYVENGTETINLDVSWGDYAKSSEQREGKEGKIKNMTVYKRQPFKETLTISLPDLEKHPKEYLLPIDSNIKVYVTRIKLKNGFSLITAYVINKRPGAENSVDAIMFQVEIKAYACDGQAVFVAEHVCREVLQKDEFYFEQRPIFSRGRGCAAIWEAPVDARTTSVCTAFIPQHEFAGVSSTLEGFDKFFFSMRFLGRKAKKDEIVDRLNCLANAYDNWIQKTLVENPKMKDEKFQSSVGDIIVDNCITSLNRIREGIKLLVTDELAFDAFCFMNRVMILQRNIMNYSKKHGQGITCNFKDFVDPNNPDNEFGWRPFQIAFILMNLNAMVNPLHVDREIVDLLYFPTGGGKTEAYLGMMAFVIANRRLRVDDGEFNKDGGVTAILRYTLRLLTTQQRDRITKMVIAAEMVRKREYPKYGQAPVSIGFWVGGGVTPNNFNDLKEDPDDPGKARHNQRLLYRQLPVCPFCGNPLSEDEFYINTEKGEVKIFCADKDCVFYKYDSSQFSIPVYLVDEEIYRKCPTIILSTVDKFARLPWDVKTNTLFGRVDRLCSRHGYIAIGEEHTRHNKTEELEATKPIPVKPFAPPELIVQDELHLITGPLGTIYGAYETIIEDLCIYKDHEKTIRPKYIVSTATIKNAGEQVKSLYGRRNVSQFPANGFEIGDSFFVKEVPTKTDPFRKYVGICASGQSMKTALLRVYAIILQTAFELANDEGFKNYIDPYYSLVGYFNSTRELGGTNRLLQDDIPKRIYRIKKKYGYSSTRFLNKRIEITSRISSYDIPKRLSLLEAPISSKECLDTAIATNMIAVGMDVDRLGLMIVTGQPKQNSEYIQATSRIGRAFPGLVITIYNPYRPRDLSHYENFSGYHAQLYRFVEGTTATPFSARARDRVLHAIVISAIRLKFPSFAENAAAGAIPDLSDDQLAEIKALIIDRLNIIKPAARDEAEEEIESFIDSWKTLAAQQKPLRYYVFTTKDYNRLMNRYSESCSDIEKATLDSMREVESAANMYYYTEE